MPEVSILVETDWSNEQKRETAVDLAKAEARQAGREVRESAIRATVEAAVVGFKKIGTALEELGQEPEVETVEV